MKNGKEKKEESEIIVLRLRELSYQLNTCQPEERDNLNSRLENTIDALENELNENYVKREKSKQNNLSIGDRSTFELFEILKYQYEKKIVNTMTHGIIGELENRFFKKEVLDFIKRNYKEWIKW